MPNTKSKKINAVELMQQVANSLKQINERLDSVEQRLSVVEGVQTNVIQNTEPQEIKTQKSFNSKLIASRFINDLNKQNKLSKFFTKSEQPRVEQIVLKYFTNLQSKFDNEEAKIKYMSIRKAYSIALIQCSAKLSQQANTEHVNMYVSAKLAEYVNKAISFIKKGASKKAGK